MKRNRTYIYRSGNYDLIYESYYKKGSYRNFRDLVIKQRQLYGIYSIIKNFDLYLKELYKISIYK